MQKGFIFDLDGTVYLDNRLIDGADEAIQTLIDRGDIVTFLTNKSTETICSYVKKLNRLGIEVNEKNVINSNYLVALYLKKSMEHDERVLVIGEKPLVDELSNMGIRLTKNSQNASYVVLGWDRYFTYNKLNDAYQAWRNGAKIIATNPDRTCPVEGGQVPDCGAIIGAMEGATGENVDIVLGKPSLLAAEYIVEEVIHLSPEQCYIVGDRLETDIQMGLDYGMQTVLVLTGITNMDLVKASPIKPNFILDNIQEIINL
ncbi:MAG TPA: HAD-IIA family hydrolase [Bacillota bacterium]